MSAAIYSSDPQWEIPGYVWSAVLAGSAAVHVVVVLFVVAGALHPAETPAISEDLELVLETDVLEFSETRPLDAVPAVAASIEDRFESRPVEALRPQPVQSVAVAAPAPEGAEIVAAAPRNGLHQTTPLSLTPKQPEILSVPVPAQKTVEKNAPVAASSPATPSAMQAATTQIYAGGPSIPAKVPVEERVLTNVATTVPTNVQHVRPAETALPSKVQARPEMGTGASVVAVEASAPALQPGFPSASVPAVQGARPVDNQSAATVNPLPDLVSVTAEPVRPVPTAKGPGGISPLAPVEGRVPPTVSATVPHHLSSQGESAAAGNIAAVEIAPVNSAKALSGLDPVEQEIAAIASLEIDHTAISPSEIEGPQVSTVLPSGHAADNVSAAQVASIDPLANAQAYVAGFETGKCTHLTVMSAGAQSAAVTAYGDDIAAVVAFDRKFANDHGYEAKIELRLISQGQCGLLQALERSGGIDVAGLVDLDRSEVRSGANVSGVIQRDLPLAKIADANAAGLALEGRGPPEIYLIDGSGQIHDGRRYLLPESHSSTAGGWRFSFPVTLKSVQDQETALVLAIWNRPQERQPSGFNSLPANRIAGVLAHPGVFSLAAIKVSRR